MEPCEAYLARYLTVEGAVEGARKSVLSRRLRNGPRGTDRVVDDVPDRVEARHDTEKEDQEPKRELEGGRWRDSSDDDSDLVGQREIRPTDRVRKDPGDSDKSAHE